MLLVVGEETQQRIRHKSACWAERLAGWGDRHDKWWESGLHLHRRHMINIYISHIYIYNNSDAASQ